MKGKAVEDDVKGGSRWELELDRQKLVAELIEARIGEKTLQPTAC